MSASTDAAALLSTGQMAYQAAHVPPQLGHVNSVAKANKVAQDFEAFFLGQMLQPMFQDIPTDGPMGGGSAEGMWRQMLVDEVGKSMAKAGGIGLAAQVKHQLLQAQEAHAK
jgi:Rod binding domain-containing protein